MKISGWIFLIFSWSIILAISFFCFRNIFKGGFSGEEKEDNQKK